MKNRIAIIGSGPTCIYILKQLVDESAFFKSHLHSITIFEKSNNAGMGMPYNPENTDIYNLSNISSEEIPMLNESFADWLEAQPKEVLKSLNVTEFPISKSKVYSRLALGYYLKDQFEKIVSGLEQKGFTIIVKSGVKIIDIQPGAASKDATLFSSNSKKYEGFHKVIIATGHMWSESDQSEYGYFASPWPIHKILPDQNNFFNFSIGTLGASLSAFDVVNSLAHRHGTFQKSDQGLIFKLHKNAHNFKLVMYSAEGWLPHLQYEQEKPIREIYRHTSREEMLSLIDTSGFLPLSDFFDKVCRPALLLASEKDGNTSLHQLLSQDNFGFKEFVDYMEDNHEYANSFEGMRKELSVAKGKMLSNQPTHWMETLDDLMYCLNFHAELISAEDYLFFRKKVMPFLMSVIAALPLSSAHVLLALYDAGCIALIKGFVKIKNVEHNNNKTTIEVSNEGEKTDTVEYKMFINCSGQGSMEFEDYPFPTLLKENKIRKARTKFKSTPASSISKTVKDKKLIFRTNNETYLYTDGIDIDPGYRIIDSKSTPSPIISDVSFIHASGCRPYSYGLQACNATSAILIEQLKQDFKKSENLGEISIKDITEIYDNNEDL